MIMDILVTGTTVAAAYSAGFWIGKADKRMMSAAGKEESADEEVEISAGSAGELEENNGIKRGRKRKEWGNRHIQEKLQPGTKRIVLGRAIGSPATGEVSYFKEGGRRGALIHSGQGKLYAPVSGKIVRLFPTGNSMLLRTDYGVELMIQAGIGTEELEGLYYRPRVVQNEFVSKGKLLLEYDPEGIRREGFDPSVLMSVEDAQEFRDITVSDAPHVKNGEDIMWVRR